MELKLDPGFRVIGEYFSQIDSQYRVNLTQIFSNYSESRVELYLRRWLNFFGQDDSFFLSVLKDESLRNSLKFHRWHIGDSLLEGANKIYWINEKNYILPSAAKYSLPPRWQILRWEFLAISRFFAMFTPPTKFKDLPSIIGC